MSVSQAPQLGYPSRTFRWRVRRTVPGGTDSDLPGLLGPRHHLSFWRVGMTCASRAIPSVPPFPPNRFNLAKSDWTSTSSSLAQCPLPPLETNKSRSTLVTGRNLPSVTVVSREPSLRSNASRSGPVRRIAGNQERSSRYICPAGSVMVSDTDDRACVSNSLPVLIPTSLGSRVALLFGSSKGQLPVCGVSYR